MALRKPVDTFTVNNDQCSALFVSPKPEFISWLDGFAQSRNIEKERLYPPEENVVVLIPQVDWFSRVGELSEFINSLKPKLVQAELYRLRATEQQLGPATSETFDRFFECYVRHYVYLFDRL